jgi:hypothetical protein
MLLPPSDCSTAKLGHPARPVDEQANGRRIDERELPYVDGQLAHAVGDRGLVHAPKAAAQQEAWIRDRDGAAHGDGIGRGNDQLEACELG